MALVGVFAFLLLLPAASADGSWSGSGTYTITSTPSNPPCSGQGTATISLDDGGGALTGTLTFKLTSQSSGCGGRLSSGGTAYLTGTISGGSIHATDQASDTETGTLSGSSLSMSLATPRQGGGCAAYCQQNAQFSFTGSGTLVGGAGFAPLQLASAGIAALFGLGAVGAGAAAGRAPRIARSHQGFTYKYDNGVFTRLDGPAPWGYSATPPPPPPPVPATAPAPPPPAVVPEAPPLLGPGVVSGPTNIEGPLGGVFQGTPDKPANPNPPTSIDQTQGGPSCPVHQGYCIPALENLGPGPTLRWFCPLGGHYPWG